MKFKIVLTADYELFGDGSGCIEKCVIEPTNELVYICNKYNCRITLFVDVLEYISFLNYSETEYMAELMKQQIKSLYAIGHDIQLHLHPQWLEAKYRMGKWELNYDFWRLPKVGNKKEIGDIFIKSKKVLEGIIYEIDKNYKCRAFRAGSWCIQPEEDILDIMRELNFFYDTTVAPGRYENNTLVYYDFRKIPNKPFWNICKNVTENCEVSNLKEIPITTIKLNLLEKFFFKIIKKGKIKTIAKGCKGQPASKKFIKKQNNSFIKKIESSYVMLDFCSMTANEMIYCVKKFRKKWKDNINEIVPIVMIGHPKNYDNNEELEKFFKWVINQKDIEFDSLNKNRFWQEKI